MTRITDPSYHLRDFHTPPALPASPKLGLDLANLHHPDLRLSDYIHRELADPPAAITRPHPGFDWGMLGNDTLRDCVVATMLHSIEDFHLDAGYTPPGFTSWDAISLYSALTGYQRDEPKSDRGVDENVAMRYWEHPGLRVGGGNIHKIAATVAVDPTNLNECRIAIDEFIVLRVAVAMPLSVQGESEWDLVVGAGTDESAPGSWGGHGILYREYDPEMFKCVTWGAELLVTVPFHLEYVRNAHVVVTQEMLGKHGIGPSGVAWDELIADIKGLPPQGFAAGERAGAPLIRLG